MPVSYLPAPTAGGVIPATSVGPGTAQPAAMGGSGLASMASNPGLMKLVQAMIAAKKRAPPPVPTPAQALGIDAGGVALGGAPPPGQMGPP